LSLVETLVLPEEGLNAVAESVCPSCAEVCPRGARFCPTCGLNLRATSPPRDVKEERRIITTMFCDLVSYTALCERADAEDVDRMLRAYSSLARHVVQQYGGVVEKFIGDAVVGVFGVPVAHEDDAERAVRAALRLLEHIGELPQPCDEALRARVGIETGEALVRLDVEPGSGESFHTGDAVNTAARLQKLAPPGGIVVGDSTHAMAAHVALFERLSPVRLRGKAQATQPWLVTGGVARTGVELRRVFSTPFVGREVELAILGGMFEKARASSNPQFALLVGEAGMGKSRLIVELAQRLDSDPGIVATWRQASCPAYGEGLTLWPLAQIARDHAGILEGDDAGEIDRKLQRVLAGEPDGNWIAGRLQPLLGLPSPQATREENFAAWLRFLEILSRERPTVLVLEDVHWAGDLLLDFLDYVVRNIGDVPLLGIGTTRPDLLDAHPAYRTRPPDDASISRVVQLEVPPLSADESQRLVEALTQPHDMSAARAGIIGRSGGNPLFVEELVRLFEDSSGGEGDDNGGLRDMTQLRLSASLQTLIAARLDSLKPGLKRLLSDAAVVGEVFWEGALAAVSGLDPQEVEGALAELEARKLVRRSQGSQMEGEVELSFWHSLTRDVAYGQLPRGARAARHKDVAEWLAGRASSASLPAHHFAMALELARAAHQNELAACLMGPAVDALTRAGDRTLPVDVQGARHQYARALGFLPADAAERGPLLVAWGESLAQEGDLEGSQRAFEEGVAAFLDRKREPAAAAAMTRLSWVLGMRGDTRTEDLVHEALRLVARRPACPESADVLEHAATHFALAGHCHAAIRHADEALSVRERLGMPPSLRARHYRALARCELGDPKGLDELAETLQIARSLEAGHEVSALYYNLAEQLMAFRGPQPAIDTCHEGLEFAKLRGDALAAGYLEAGLLHYMMWAGEWRQILDGHAALAEHLRQHDETWDLKELLALTALVFALTGRLPDARATADRAQEILDATFSAGTYGSARMPYLAAARMSLGDAGAALDLLERFESMSSGRSPHLGTGLPFALRTAVEAGDEELAGRFAERERRATAQRAFESCALGSFDAMMAERSGDVEGAAAAFARAATAWSAFGVPLEEALARLGEGRCLMALGRAEQAKPALVEAHAVFARLGAMPAVSEKVLPRS
jgi:class 3 adenylate cyclase/tetratricopeptide (TPR) repeat protein